MPKIIWRNGIGYVTEQRNGYRVYFGHMGGIIQCFHLTPEGLDEAKQLLIDAANQTCKECGGYVDDEGEAIHGCSCEWGPPPICDTCKYRYCDGGC